MTKNLTDSIIIRALKLNNIEKNIIFYNLADTSPMQT